ECKINEDGEKNESNKMNKVVSTRSDESLQASKKGEKNLPLSGNQPVRKIKCTSEIPNNEIIKNKHKLFNKPRLYTNQFNNSNAEKQCNPNSTTKMAREGQGCDDEIVTWMTNLIKRNYFMNEVKCISITWAVEKFGQYLRNSDSPR
ncbi:7677_t:CDS:2, partial [Racocetra persica]